MSTKREVPFLEPRPPLEWLAELQGRFAEVDPTALIGSLRLINLGRGILAKFTPAFASIGLTEARFTAVLMIYRLEWETGYATPSQLAEHAGIGRAAMSQLLDGLVEAEWVERAAHSEDRRKVMVRLSKKGRRRLERFLPGHYERIAKAMERLSETERATLMRLLDKVQAGVDALE